MGSYNKHESIPGLDLPISARKKKTDNKPAASYTTLPEPPTARQQPPQASPPTSLPRVREFPEPSDPNHMAYLQCIHLNLRRPLTSHKTPPRRLPSPPPLNSNAHIPDRAQNSRHQPTVHRLGQNPRPSTRRCDFEPHHQRGDKPQDLRTGEMPAGTQSRAAAEDAKSAGRPLGAFGGGGVGFDETAGIESLGIGAEEGGVVVDGGAGHLHDAIFGEEVLVADDGVGEDFADGGVGGIETHGFLIDGDEEGALGAQFGDVDAVGG